MNRIGLSIEKSETLAKELNHLLANYQVFYANARGFHWNIKGEKFFELHEKFEALYNDLFLKIDEVAERILTLGGQPVHTFQDFLDLSELEVKKGVSSASETVQAVLESFENIISLQRSIMEMAGEASDEGTSALMSDYIREQEKEVWMYSSYLA